MNDRHDMVSGVQQHLQQVLRELEELSALVQRSLEEIEGAGTSPSRLHLARLTQPLQTTLERSEAWFDGVGIAVTPGYLVDCEYWIEWWRKSARGSLEFVAHRLNPESEFFYDYVHRPWYARPMELVMPVVTGPYVDAGGTNGFTVTVATPVFSRGSLIGVLGADFRAAMFETLLIQVGGERETVLVNTAGRVIASTSPRHLPGQLFHAAELDDWHEDAVEHQALPDAHWSLFTRDSSATS